MNKYEKLGCELCYIVKDFFCCPYESDMEECPDNKKLGKIIKSKYIIQVKNNKKIRQKPTVIFRCKNIGQNII